MTQRVRDKVCLITACSAPGRRAIAERLLAAGARVAIADADGLAMDTLAEQLGSDDVLPLTHVNYSPESWDELIVAVADGLGPLDVLVQGLSATGESKPLAETSLSEFRAVNEQNIEACFLGLKAVMGVMRERGHGSIVQLSSIFGAIGAPDAAAFCASAGGIRNMTKAAALEGLRDGNKIRVNLVLAGRLEGDTHPASTPAVPLSHAGTFEDIADAVVFLASDESYYMSGSVITVDGGVLSS